jgi:hypothetical protein
VATPLRSQRLRHNARAGLPAAAIVPATIAEPHPSLSADLNISKHTSTSSDGMSAWSTAKRLAYNAFAPASISRYSVRVRQDRPASRPDNAQVQASPNTRDADRLAVVIEGGQSGSHDAAPHLPHHHACIDAGYVGGRTSTPSPDNDRRDIGAYRRLSCFFCNMAAGHWLPRYCTRAFDGTGEISF